MGRLGAPNREAPHTECYTISVEAAAIDDSVTATQTVTVTVTVTVTSTVTVTTQRKHNKWATLEAS